MVPLLRLDVLARRRRCAPSLIGMIVLHPVVTLLQCHVPVLHHVVALLPHRVVALLLHRVLVLHYGVALLRHGVLVPETDLPEPFSS